MNEPIRAIGDANRQFWMVAGCFLVSGFAALLYETVWLRQFAILLGTSEQALAIVLASYMGGLAIGALVASRVVDSVQRPLLTYGLLELAIAVSALLIPIGLWLARMLQARWLGGLPEPPPAGTISQVLFNFSTAFGLILIPTSLMGATLPLLARHVVKRDEELGPRIGLLYAINTAGAVLGTLAAAFALMPTIGMRATTWIGALANAVVFLLVLLMVRSWSWSTEQESVVTATACVPKSMGSNTRESKSHDESPFRRILWLIGISGAIAFCYEILFTRMLSHMLGGSIHAFATMLAGFLLGIALGGAIASRIATTRSSSAIGFVYAQIATGVCTLLAFHLLQASVLWPWDEFGGAAATTAQVIASILILMPTATCLGLAFPLAARAFARDEREAATGAAKIFAVSTLGGIAGSLLTAAFLMPWMQYHGSTTLAIMCNFAVALAAIFWMKLPILHAGSVVAALGLLLLMAPQIPTNILRVSALTGDLTPGTIVFNHVGASATVTVFYDEGVLQFQTNGLPEARIATLDTGSHWRQAGPWLSAMPPVLRDQMKSMMIIGLGGGIAAAAVPPSVEEIDVVELASSVVDANRMIGSLREKDPLVDPRVNLVLNDARNALSLTDRRYDAIVSQPSHPWTAGASHLYTREFAALAKEHLTPGGIFLQWMSAEFVNPELLGSMSATLVDVFPHVRIYEPISDLLLFVASDEPIEPEKESALPIASEESIYYRRLGLLTTIHLLAILAADDQAVDELARDADLIRDERNLLAMRAPALIASPATEATRERLQEIHPIRNGRSHLQELCPTIDPFDYVNRLMKLEQHELVRASYQQILQAQDKRDLVAAELERLDGGQRAWLNRMDKARDTGSPLLAFHVLHANVIGRLSPKLVPENQKRLESLVLPQHRALLRAIPPASRNEFAPSREADKELASISVDDIAFETALKLRLAWRVEDTGPRRIQKYLEAIRIIDDHTAFANYNEVGLFRAMAAVKAGRSMTALATATQMARNIEQRQSEKGEPVSVPAFKMMQRVALLVADPALFPNAPRKQYREVHRLVNDVLDRLIEIRVQAGLPARPL